LLRLFSWGIVRTAEDRLRFGSFTLFSGVISAKLVKSSDLSDSAYLTGLTDCADYNHFTDFVKTKKNGK